VKGPGNGQVTKVSEFSILILVENRAKGPGIMSEHGLSLLLNLGGRFVLFDCGQGQVLPNNAKRLGIDLKDIKTVILSHGHFDHAAGIIHLREDNPFAKKVKLYAHEDAFSERYFLDGFHWFSSKKYVKDGADSMWMCGIPYTREELESYGFDIHITNESLKLEPGIIISGEVPRIQKISYPRFFLDNDGEWIEDPVRDDQFLLVNSEFGWVLVLGCNHADMVNTLPHARNLINGEKIRAIIGGTHIGETDIPTLEARNKLIQDAGVEYIIPLHCTGFAAMCLFADRYKEKFFDAKTAMKFVFSSEGIKAY
jgi:7,8-dihydropterin-6-yl-methyl-4-(beta-D-ribofuranosyl)aminobenzene 5'-phosphate synthase